MQRGYVAITENELSSGTETCIMYVFGSDKFIVSIHFVIQSGLEFWSAVYCNQSRIFEFLFFFLSLYRVKIATYVLYLL